MTKTLFTPLQLLQKGILHFFTVVKEQLFRLF